MICSRERRFVDDGSFAVEVRSMKRFSRLDLVLEAGRVPAAGVRI
jgi:hypothetical protein